MDSYLSSDEDDGEDDETEESSSETDDDSSSQLTQYNNDKLEDVCLGTTKIALPQGLCENEDVFNEFFSINTWQNVLTDHQREELKQYLPSFPNNDEQEKAETVQHLFSRSNFKFGNPLSNLFTQLHSGYLRPDIAKMRALMKKAQFREYRYRQRRHGYRAMRSMLVSRRRLLAVASSQPPDTPPRVERLIPPPRISPKEQRARRRYFEELLSIRKAEGETSQSSEDENYPEGPPPRLTKKQKKQLASMELSLSPDLAPIPSTLNKSSSTPFQLETRVTPTFNPYEITEESYKTMLIKHKKRRSRGEDHPELNIKGISLQEVAQRSQTSRRTPNRNPVVQPESQSSRSKKKIKLEPATTPSPSTLVASDARNSPSIYSEDSCSIGFSEINNEVEVPEKPKRRKSVQPMVQIKQEVIDEEELQDWEDTSVSEPPTSSPAVVVSPVQTPTTTTIVSAPAPLPSLIYQKSPIISNDVKPQIINNLPVVTFQSKTQLKPIDVINLPIEIEEAPAPSVTLTIRPELELTQETHVCFLSLVRDIICSTPDQRMGLAALEQRLRAWQESPISPLNDWYSLAPSWVSLLPSAVNFLSGDFPTETQPEDFVPYLEYKPHMQAYQWIGAGRDSDHHLAPLCTHWLERRNEVPTVPVREEEQAEEAGLSTPPPPRCPTSWQARSAVGAERESFHAQEKRRYENPNRAFTYRMHGFESVVSPVKGAYTLGAGLTKPRGHTLLVPERPNYITILSLVRDAVARLPNGEGTRTDICELLRDSQYLSPGAEENYLQSVVGGALDRLHYETDTCVKYDPKRKTWIYLHRNRTEEEFEKLHQQQSNQPKSKRPANRKASRARAKEKDIKPIQMVTTALASVLAPNRLVEQASGSVSTPTLPTPVAPVKASPVATTVPRTFTLSSGSLQVATSSGMIQVSAAPALAGGSSLLTTSAGQTVKLAAVKKSGNITTLSSAGLTQQALAAARLMVSSGGTITMTKPVMSVATPQQQPKLTVVSSATTTTAPTTSSPLVLHPVSRPGAAKGLLANVNTAQLVNVSQMQLVNAARALQQQQIQIQQQQLKQQQLQQTQSQTQAIQQGQPQQIQIQIQQQQQQQIKTQQVTQSQQIQIQQLQQKQITKQVQKQQIQKKRQIQLQIQQQQKFQQQKQVFEHKLQQIQVDSSQTLQVQTNAKTVASSMAAGVKLLSAQAAVKNLTSGDGSPLHGTQAIFIKHNAGSSATNSETQIDCVTTSTSTLLLSKSLQTAGATLVKAGLVTGTTSSSGTLMTSRPHVITTAGGKPMVAKVLTNAQGQLISMESLIAHQKQQQLAASGVRVPGAKPAQQASLIQLPGTGGVPQFAMVTQGGIVGPRLLQAAAQQFQQQQAQQQAVQQNKTLPTMRMVTPGSTTGLNVATIGGQPVILASKTQGAMAGQNVFLASSGGGSPAVVLTSPAGLRTQQGGTLVLQPGAAQQIVLPHGFQSGTLNFKSLQSLQGIRVIPLAQATAAASSANTSMPKGRQQVYARIITPPNRVATAAAAAQNTESNTNNTDATE